MTHTYKKVVTAMLVAFCLTTSMQSAVLLPMAGVVFALGGATAGVSLVAGAAAVINHLASVRRRPSPNAPTTGQVAPDPILAFLDDVVVHVHALLALEAVTQAQLNVCLNLAILVSNSPRGMELLQEVIDAGSDVNHGDASGNMPLMLAIQLGRRAAIVKLLQNGALLEPANPPAAPTHNAAANQAAPPPNTQVAVATTRRNQ